MKKLQRNNLKKFQGGRTNPGTVNCGGGIYNLVLHCSCKSANAIGNPVGAFKGIKLGGCGAPPAGFHDAGAWQISINCANGVNCGGSIPGLFVGDPLFVCFCGASPSSPLFIF